jgi:S1-C subfamily serine protease
MTANRTIIAAPSPSKTNRRLWQVAAALWLVVAAALGAALLARTGVIPLPGDAAKITALEEMIAQGRKSLASSDCPPLANGAGAAQEAPHNALSRDDLVKRLEHGAVLVLTEDTSGSGFFVAPNLIVTNRHVVAEDRTGEVLITSKAIGSVIRGRIVARTPAGQPGSADFALIEVAPVATATPMPIRTDVNKLEHVVAAGYPGMVLDSDEGFRKLLAGDMHAAPDLNLSDGTVSSVQTSSFGMAEILHSATVLKGNSGGPLVDSCGDVTGINTFIEVDNTQSGHLNYSLSSRNLLDFLNKVHAPVSVRDGPCG